MDIYFILCLEIWYNFAYFFLLKLFQLWPLGTLSMDFCVLWHITMGVGLLVSCLFCFLSTSFLSGALRCSRLVSYVFPILALGSAISPRSLLENDTRNQALGIRCTCYYWGFVALGLLSWQSKEIYVCIQIAVYTHACKYFYVCIKHEFTLGLWL